MKTRPLLKLALCFLTTALLPPAELARAEESEPQQQEEESRDFLKRDLKYLPVHEFLPTAVLAIERALGGDAKALPGVEKESDAVSARLVGGTLLIANPQLNRLIVSGSEEHLQLIDRLADEIDVRPRQVYIKAIVVRVTLSDEMKYGLDALVEGTFAEARLGGDLVKGIDLIRATENPALIKDIAVNAINVRRSIGGGSGIFEITRLGEATEPPPSGPLEMNRDLEFYLSTLAGRSDQFEVIASKYATATNNQQSRISAAEGLQISLTPLINSKDEVTFNIEARRVTPVEADPESQSIQELNSTVRLPDRGTFVSGGFIQDQDGERTELLVLVQPWIIP